ncbi:MAG: hypothetical protein ABMA13_23415 [Chthoniobacteraceae bacterium]
MQSKSVTEIRSLGFTKVNRLVRAHRHLDDLRPAFAEWQAGEIYVCKKTGSYRYRFGDKSKSPTPWSKLAEQLFDGPAAFALAALVLAPPHVEQPAEVDGKSHTPSGRADIVALAAAA